MMIYVTKALTDAMADARTALADAVAALDSLDGRRVPMLRGKARTDALAKADALLPLALADADAAVRQAGFPLRFAETRADALDALRGTAAAYRLAREADALARRLRREADGDGAAAAYWTGNGAAFPLTTARGPLALPALSPSDTMPRAYLLRRALAAFARMADADAARLRRAARSSTARAAAHAARDARALLARLDAAPSSSAETRFIVGTDGCAVRSYNRAWLRQPTTGAGTAREAAPLRFWPDAREAALTAAVETAATAVADAAAFVGTSLHAARLADALALRAAARAAAEGRERHVTTDDADALRRAVRSRCAFVARVGRPDVWHAEGDIYGVALERFGALLSRERTAAACDAETGEPTRWLYVRKDGSAVTITRRSLMRWAVLAGARAAGYGADSAQATETRQAIGRADGSDAGEPREPVGDVSGPRGWVVRMHRPGYLPDGQQGGSVSRSAHLFVGTLRTAHGDAERAAVVSGILSRASQPLREAVAYGLLSDARDGAVRAAVAQATGTSASNVGRTLATVRLRREAGDVLAEITDAVRERASVAREAVTDVSAL